MKFNLYFITAAFTSERLARCLVLTILISLEASLEAGDWPHWRGPLRDGHAAAGEREPDSLDPDMKPVWKIQCGSGFAGVVVQGNRVALFAEDGEAESIWFLNAADGKEIWRQPVGPRFGDEWGSGPRSTPIMDGERICALSCVGEFASLSAGSGKPSWRTSFEKDFGVGFLGNKANEGTARRRGNNGSGVIEGNRLLLPVGGSDGNSLVCFDKSSGKVLWKSGSDEAAYSSLVISQFAGIPQAVWLNAEVLLGADLADGRILWRVPLVTAAKRHAASPVIHGNRIFVNSHTFGLACFEIVRTTNGGWHAQPVWTNATLKINIATPVLVNSYLYSQGANKDFVCVDTRDGKVFWSQSGFGAGRKDYSSAIAIGAKILVLTEVGQLLLIAADPAGYREHGRAQVCGNTWSFPAFANGRLYVRDGRSLACYELLPGMK